MDKNTGDNGVGNRRIRVLESFAPPHDRTNPYSVLLFDSIAEQIDAEYFTWRRALRHDYDVLHLHWPEVKVRGTSPLRSVIRSVAFVAVLLRIRLTGRALVRTLHDATPHERPTFWQRRIIRLSERWTTLWITLTPSVQPSTPAPLRVIPHGHYRDWFAPSSGAESVRGRILHFGQLRPYKGTVALIEAFMALPDRQLSLRVVGSAPDDELRATLVALCARDDRVELLARYVPDDELRGEILASEIVVLPYLNITNSGSLLLALSLDRPALAAGAPAIRQVAAEVGPGWVQVFDGRLDSDTLDAALTTLRLEPPAGRPDLAERDWAVVGAAHVEAFAAAIRLVTRR